jgi:hypothetical protein
MILFIALALFMGCAIVITTELVEYINSIDFSHTDLTDDGEF